MTDQERLENRLNRLEERFWSLFMGWMVTTFGLVLVIILLGGKVEGWW